MKRNYRIEKKGCANDEDSEKTPDVGLAAGFAPDVDGRQSCLRTNAASRGCIFRGFRTGCRSSRYQQIDRSRGLRSLSQLGRRTDW